MIEVETLKNYITDYGSNLRYDKNHKDKKLAGKLKGRAMAIKDLEKAGFSHAQLKKLEREGKILTDTAIVKNFFGHSYYKLYYVPCATTEEFLDAIAHR